MILYSFNNGLDGFSPSGTLARDTSGNLSTRSAINGGGGIVYQLITGSHWKRKHSV